MYQLIDNQQIEFPVAEQCAVLKVSRSGFYAWKNGRSHQPSEADELLFDRLADRFAFHKKRYGSRRLQAELAAQFGQKSSRHRIRRWMKRGGMVAIQPRSFVPRTTDSRHTRQPAPNLLAERKISHLNEAWVGDITYLPMADGSFSYLATWIDVHSRRVVGWHAERHMRAELIEKALEKAVFRRKQIPEGLLIHSDRGSQYASTSFRNLLVKRKMTQSMSDRDNPYDNAMAESFFSRLKAESIQKTRFQSIEELRNHLFDFIDGYYNPVRLHSAIQYISPIQFENLLLK